MGLSVPKELPHNRKDYNIHYIGMGKLWIYDDSIDCTNCKSEKVIALVTYQHYYLKKSIVYNYCFKCLYFPLSLRWQAIYSTNIPLELKQEIFKKFMSVIT